jgi:hypothetical protein
MIYIVAILICLALLRLAMVGWMIVKIVDGKTYYLTPAGRWSSDEEMARQFRTRREALQFCESINEARFVGAKVVKW